VTAKLLLCGIIFISFHTQQQTAARTKPPAAYIEKVSAFKRCAGACSVLFKSQRTDFTAAACVVMWQKEAQSLSEVSDDFCCALLRFDIKASSM
jgi:hypothetical protein